MPPTGLRRAWQSFAARMIPGLSPPTVPFERTPAYYRPLIEEAVARDLPIAPVSRFERGSAEDASRIRHVARNMASVVVANWCEARFANPAVKARRAQHAKAHGCVRAKFIVRDDLPSQFAVGLFRPGAVYDAEIRFSNAMAVPQSDRKGDGRGMAIRLQGTPGTSLLHAMSPEAEADRASVQDFMLVSYPVFFAKDLATFAVFSDILVLPTNTWLDTVRLIAAMARFFVTRPALFRLFILTMSTRVDSPLHATYYSMTPYLFGPETVVRYIAAPEHPSESAEPGRSDHFLADALSSELDPANGRSSQAFNFLVQVRASPTPDDVEDASASWTAAADVTIPLARIEIPTQSFDKPEQQWDCENLSFNPWRSLPEHRPLGGLNRLRLAVYLASSAVRHRLNMVDSR
jgi:hypothetical protein